MAKYFDYLLLGGGTSCGYAAAAIRELDNNGSIGIVGADSEPPYDRPPFSKGFLWNDDMVPSDAHSKDESFYPENAIAVMTGQKAVEIDRSSKSVRLESGETLNYGKLLYALGSVAAKLPVPGGDSVLTLRTAADSARIRVAAKTAKSAVIVGGGYIGSELCAALLKLGLSVVLLERNERMLGAVPSVVASVAVQHELESKGAEICIAEEVKSIEDGTVITVSGRMIPADLIIAGVGAIPQTQLAKEAGLEIGVLGVRANSELRTNDNSIWVAGDIAEYEDTILGKPFHAEHHLHAKWSGAHAGKAMAGDSEKYRKVPYFYSDIGDLSLYLRGYPMNAAHSYILGNTQTPEFTELFVFSDGRLAGMVDVRRDWKAQDPISDHVEKLMLEGKNVGDRVAEMSQPNFDVLSL